MGRYITKSSHWINHLPLQVKNANGDAFMKKTLLILGAAIIFILLVGAFFLAQNWDYVDELEYRTSRYHTFGEISVLIDGQQINVDDIPLQFIYSDGNHMETTSINNNVFKIKKGEYGINEYVFSLLLSDVDVSADCLNIRVEHFNTNWWHVSDLSININISTEPLLKASMSGSIDTRMKGGSCDFDFETQEEEISQSNNILRVRTASP